jgi:AraC-like DNA-binding protein
MPCSHSPPKTFARKIASTIGVKYVAKACSASLSSSSVNGARIATFYRVFRSVYGMTPGDVRASSFNA